MTQADNNPASRDRAPLHAPVIIPTLNRHEYLKRLIESLAANSWAGYTDIYIGLDYPPAQKYVEGWKKIRQYLKEGDFKAFRSFNVIERTENFGYFRNTDDLRDTVYRDHDAHILLADDLVVSPDFLEYMHRCLGYYRDDNSVALVCGYSYPVDWIASEGATCILQDFNAAEWGIGLWRDKGRKMTAAIENDILCRRLPEALRHNLFDRMTDVEIDEYIRAACTPAKLRPRFTLMRRVCDISMRAYLTIMSKYAVTPIVSKVRQYGFDGSGIFCPRIDSGINGDVAGTYNYSAQPIDSAEHFTLVEDTLHDCGGNRLRMNAFDYRSRGETRQARRLLWICRHLGIGSAKAYYGALLALWILPERAFKKIARKVKKNNS